MLIIIRILLIFPSSVSTPNLTGEPQEVQLANNSEKISVGRH